MELAPDARVYYVSADAREGNPGTLARPFRSIQAAIDVASPGDQILVRGGFYTENLRIAGLKASSDRPTVLRAQGHVVVTTDAPIELADKSVSDKHSDLPLSDPQHPYHIYSLGGLIRIENCTHLVLDGFEVRNSAWFGVVARDCTSLTITNCKTNRSMASGIYVLDSTQVTVSHNEVTKACAYPVRLPGCEHGSQECISLVNTSHFEIAYNVVHESGIWTHHEGGGSGVGGEGIDVKEASHSGTMHHNYTYNLSRLGLYVDAWASDLRDVEVYENVVHNCMHGTGLGCEDGGALTNIVIRDNVFYDCLHFGVILSSWGKSGSKRQIEIARNIIYRCGTAGIDLGSELHEDITVTGNTVCLNHDPNNEDGERVDLLLGDAKNVTLADNSIGEIPNFRDPLNGDFTILDD